MQLYFTPEIYSGVLCHQFLKPNKNWPSKQTNPKGNKWNSTKFIQEETALRADLPRVIFKTLITTEAYIIACDICIILVDN